MLINLHDGSLITTSIAIVGGREYRHHIPILAPVVAFHNQLMGSCNKRQPVVMVEGLADVLSKSIACTTRTYAPSTSVVWV